LGAPVELLRVKSDVPTKFKKWVDLMENRTDKKVRMVMFNNVKELVARQMKELHDKRSIQIIMSEPTHLQWCCNLQYSSHVASLRPPSVVLGGSNSDLYVPAESHSNGNE